jgi:hypothetical protein
MIIQIVLPSRSITVAPGVMMFNHSLRTSQSVSRLRFLTAGCCCTSRSSWNATVHRPWRSVIVQLSVGIRLFIWCIPSSDASTRKRLIRCIDRNIRLFRLNATVGLNPSRDLHRLRCGPDRLLSHCAVRPMKDNQTTCSRRIRLIVGVRQRWRCCWRIESVGHPRSPF